MREVRHVLVLHRLCTLRWCKNIITFTRVSLQHVTAWTEIHLLLPDFPFLHPNGICRVGQYFIWTFCVETVQDSWMTVHLLLLRVFFNVEGDCNVAVQTVSVKYVDYWWSECTEFFIVGYIRLYRQTFVKKVAFPSSDKMWTNNAYILKNIGRSTPKLWNMLANN